MALDISLNPSDRRTLADALEGLEANARAAVSPGLKRVLSVSADEIRALFDGEQDG
jgi:hypothetical protein